MGLSFMKEHKSFTINLFNSGCKPIATIKLIIMKNLWD